MQTVNEARYTFWHTVIDIWQVSGQSKDEWCWANKVPLKTFVHYEGIFRRQKARGYVYQNQEAKDDTAGTAEKLPVSTMESPYVEIPMLQEDSSEDQVKGHEEEQKGHYNKKQKRDASAGGPEDLAKTQDLVIQRGGCRLEIGGKISETMLRSILKAVSADA